MMILPIPSAACLYSSTNLVRELCNSIDGKVPEPEMIITTELTATETPLELSRPLTLPLMAEIT